MFAKERTFKATFLILLTFSGIFVFMLTVHFNKNSSLQQDKIFSLERETEHESEISIRLTKPPQQTLTEKENQFQSDSSISEDELLSLEGETEYKSQISVRITKPPRQTLTEKDNHFQSYSPILEDGLLSEGETEHKSEISIRLTKPPRQTLTEKDNQFHPYSSISEDRLLSLEGETEHKSEISIRLFKPSRQTLIEKDNQFQSYSSISEDRLLSFEGETEHKSESSVRLTKPPRLTLTEDDNQFQLYSSISEGRLLSPEEETEHESEKSVSLTEPRRQTLNEKDNQFQSYSSISKVTESSYANIEKDSTTQRIMVDPLNKCLKHKNISLAFSKLMYELHIQAVLIEPHALFCLMTGKSRAHLIEKPFNILDYPQSENITRFALIGENVEKLKKLKTRIFLKTHGFRYEGVLDNFDVSNSITQNYSISHHFFARSGHIIHAVVLKERGDYLWLKKISYIPKFQNLLEEDFKFYKHDTAYERFSIYLRNTTEGSVLIVPADPESFLYQLNSAKFLECDLSRARHISKDDTRSTDLENAFVNALKEFKTHLQPLLINFFIYGGTLLGWYRQCGIIPYTSDIDFAAWASDVGSSDFWINTFGNYPNLRLLSTMGLPEEAFELKFYSVSEAVDLFFVYKDGNTTWISGHRPSKGYYFRYSHPMFTLCSVDLLGYKVLVPCETLEVILAEYGPEWDKPVSSWYYETSPKNMGPRIFWPDDKIDEVYREL